MNRVCALLCLSLSSSAAFLLQGCGGASAQEVDRVVTWKGMAGVISAVNVDNPVSHISSGTFPWTARAGSATVDLGSGTASFEVDGLVINGTMFSGNAGPITAVTGTLVCNPGDNAAEAILDTPAVPLSVQGSARFSGRIENIPAVCAKPVFLVRISTPAGAAGRWIATATEPGGAFN